MKKTKGNSEDHELAWNWVKLLNNDHVKSIATSLVKKKINSCLFYSKLLFTK